MPLDTVKQRMQASSSSAFALWKLKEEKADHDKVTPMLSLEFTAKNFQAALDALNVMGAVAEREQHHPDFHLVEYRNVRVDIWTHKLGGITENDILLAEMISEEVKVVFSPKWLKENPSAATMNKEN